MPTGDDIVKWLRTGLFAVSCAVGGAMLKDFVDFQGKERELTQKSVEQAVAASDTLAPLLRKFADKALGKGAVTDEDREAFRSSLQKQYAAADLATKNLPNVKPQFEAFADAIVQLQRSALAMQGPADAQSFVQDLSKYYASERQFQEAAISSQRRYFSNVWRYI